jgi:plastocyanin
MRGKAFGAAMLAVALMLAGTACGSDETGGDGGGGGGGGAAADLVTRDTAFVPTTVTVASGGDQITITNEDGFDHTFTLDDGSVDMSLPAGETVTAEVNITADAPFHCAIHSSMTGTLTVG